MEDEATAARDEFLAFELALDEQVCDEVRREGWGRLFLTPSTPLIWDQNWVGIEETGLSIDEVVAISDEALGGAGFEHRTVCALDQADGRRLGEELEADPERFSRWEVERTRYMAWRGEARSQKSPHSDENCERASAREVGLAEIAGLRRAILAEETVPSGQADPAAVVDQLFELDRRYGVAGGDRWFVAPAEGEPLACCRLLRDGTIGQIEDVGTRRAGRERGYARAIVTAALATSVAAGDAPIFLTAEAADWPQLFYERLGFETVGDLTILRRRP